MGDVTRIPRKDSVDGYEIEPHEPSIPEMLLRETMDGFLNQITGVGDVTRDKTMAGQIGGPSFIVNLLTGVECENRWRGSDLGGRIIETLPDEMTREGWDLIVQPTEDEQQAQPRADFGDPLTAPAPPAAPGALPEGDHEAQAVTEAMDAKMTELRAVEEFHQALSYERAFGGAAIMIGVDEGGLSAGKLDRFDSTQRELLSAMGYEDMDQLDAADPRNLTAPLDEKAIRSVKHLTTFRGGWDGEIIAWRYYNDPRQANYGMPSVYMVRNIGVPLAAPPAPGERITPNPNSGDPYRAPGMPTSGPVTVSPMIFWIHESRLLVFPGTAVSRWARVQMRGWGDSIFTRVNEVLSQYSQTWGGVAILMQEWSQGVLKIKGFAQMLLKNTPDANGKLAQRALMLQLTQSIARTRIIDSEEEFKREVTPLSGIADVLDAFANRLAAAAEIPVSLLMGQTKGGLGDTSKGEVRFFYDRVASRQRKNLMPNVRRLQRLLFIAKDSPTNGAEPDRWTVVPRALYKMNDQETADLRNKQADTDIKYITASVVSPEEVAASRFGGAAWSADTVLDLEGRAEMSKIQTAPTPEPAAATGPKAADGTKIVKAEDMPAPAPSAEEQKIAADTAELLSLTNRRDLAEKYNKPAKVAELNAKIDAHVTKMLG